MFTRKPRLQLKNFSINGAKRLLQHNLPGRDITPVVRTLGVAVDPFRQRGQYCILQSRTSN